MAGSRHLGSSRVGSVTVGGSDLRGGFDHAVSALRDASDCAANRQVTAVEALIGQQAQPGRRFGGQQRRGVEERRRTHAPDHRGEERDVDLVDQARAQQRASQPAAELVHLPVHASWLNQVEIYFSIGQGKVIKPGDFTDLYELAQRLLAFQDRYNTTAEPFDWRFGRKSLNRKPHDP